jgi:predicted acylesterase/phospholipase RssA
VCGWTGRGDRPCFAVVTGISTGALVAPFAFLGSAYDAQLERFYTTLTTRDVYRLRPVRGLFTEAFADNDPLARTLDATVTPQLVDAIAVEHSRGRRLYVGTTEVEGRRFVVWDVGAIAGRGGEPARQLIVQVLLGSSAIHGFFPPQRIPVTVDGRRYVERHVDGGVSQSLFFRPPVGNQAADALAGTDVYAVVAGKLYADPDVIRPRSLTVAAQTTSAVLYAQCRGDLTRLWTVCQLAGMTYRMTAIPAAFPAPKASTDFEPDQLRAMFDEGVRQVRAGAWRTTPPGTEPGEEILVREGTDLTEQPRVATPGRR